MRQPCTPMSDLKSRIQADLNKARRARAKERVLVLSTLLSEVRNREIEISRDLADDDVVAVVARAIKQRHDAAGQMRAGGREELAAVEEAQAELLATYQPEGLAADEVRAMVREIIQGGDEQMGPVMGKLMPLIRGRFDGKEANQIVREELDG